MKKKRIVGLAMALVLLSAINAWATPRLRILTTTIQRVMEGEEVISDDLEYVSEDLKTVAWSSTPATAGGMTFANGKFTGSAAPVGTYKFVVKVIGSYDVSQDNETVEKSITDTKTYSIVVAPWAPSEISLDKTPTDDRQSDLSTIAYGSNKAGGTSADFQMFSFKTRASVPLTSWQIDGLPKGLKVTSEDKGGTAIGSHDIEFHVGADSTKPAKPGVYTGIKLTVQNKAGKVVSKPYTLRVFDKANVTTKKLPDITWGKYYSTSLAASGGFTGYPISWDASVTNLSSLSGLSFDAETGRLFGTLASNDAVNTALPFGYNKVISVDLSFKAKSPAGTNGDSDTKTLTLNIKMAAPKILSKDEKQADFDNLGLYLSSEDGKIVLSGTDNDLIFKASGPGHLSWDVTGLPDGFTSSDEASDGFKLTATAAESKAIKKQTVTVTVSNMAGSDKATFRATILTKDNVTKFAIKDKTVTLPSGNQKVGTDAGQSAIEAYPGPVKWTANSLPTGLRLSLDKSVSYDCKVWIVGSYDKASTKANTIYKITAKNSVLGISDVVSRSITVYTSPDITTGKPKMNSKTKQREPFGTLPSLVIGTNYTAKLDVKGLNNSLDIVFAKTSPDLTATTGPTYGQNVVFDEGQYEGKLTYDYEKRTITGKLDRFPVKPTSKDKYVGSVYVRMFATNPAGMEISQDAVIQVKGTPPKFKTAKLPEFAGYGDKVDEDGENHVISVTGTKVMEMRAYISSADAKKFSLSDGTEDIIADGSGTPSITVTSDDSDPTQTKLMVGFAGDQNLSLSGVPLTISLDNGASAPVIKKYLINVVGYPPVLVPTGRYTVATGSPVSLISADYKEASKDVTLYFAAGQAITDIVFTISGDKPITYDSTPKPGTSKNGISVVSDDGGATLKITGTPTGGKETKTAVSVTLYNPQTKVKSTRKVTIIGMVAPKITSKGNALTKVVDLGKSFSFKLAASGSKPLTWSIDVKAPDGTTAISPESLDADYGLKFNEKTGVLAGVASLPTSNDHKYAPLKIDFYAINAAGTSPVASTTVGIKGAKFKMMTSTVTIQIQSSDYKPDPSGDLTLKTNISKNDQKADVQWALLKGATLPKPLAGLGVATASTRNWGSIDISGATSPTTLYATKGSTMKISVDNVGTTATASIKVIVKDPAPSFDVNAPSGNLVSVGTGKYGIKSNASSAQSGTLTFVIDKNGTHTMTGDTAMQWKLSRTPSGPVKAILKPVTMNGKANGGATVTITVNKGVSSADIRTSDKVYHTTFAVTATNKSTNASATMTLSLDVKAFNDATGFTSDTGALPAEKDALPEENEELTEEEELKQGEGTVTYGDVRNESALTQNERRLLEEGGYIIAAILPEITTDDSGQYDLEIVSLDEAAPVDGELVWFAFPRNAEDSEDDTIAEFYDEAGAEIFAVPEGRMVVPAPWLDKDVVYAPVIAVKAPVAGDAKDSLDDAEEGDTVTEKALEEAAQAPAEE